MGLLILVVLFMIVLLFLVLVLFILYWIYLTCSFVFAFCIVLFCLLLVLFVSHSCVLVILFMVLFYVCLFHAFGIILCLFVSPLIAASPLSYVHLSLEASVDLPPAALFSHLQSKFVFVLHISTIFPIIALSLKLSLSALF